MWKVGTKVAKKVLIFFSLEVGQLELSTSLPHHLPMNSIELLSLNTAEVTKPRRQHIRDGRGTGNWVRRMTLWGNSVDIWWLRFFKASKHENKICLDDMNHKSLKLSRLGFTGSLPQILGVMLPVVCICHEEWCYQELHGSELKSS